MTDGHDEGRATDAEAGATDPARHAFTQHRFHDATTGATLPYNLFVPTLSHDHATAPLVVFIHDAGVLGDDPDITLDQGDGATSWASPADQAVRPAFVLAPQYAEVVVDDWDGHVVTPMLDATIRLIEHVLATCPIDQARVYATGQSMGGMMEIVMAARRPDLFAGLYLVACQWDSAVVAPLAGLPIWILVSEGDAKAHPGQQAIVAALEEAGAEVDRAVWNARRPSADIEAAADALAVQPGNVKFVALERSSVLPLGAPDDPGAHHVQTWRLAYGIERIRRWVFEQRRPPAV